MLTIPSTIRTLLKQAVPATILLLASASLVAQQPVSLLLSGSMEVPPVSTKATGTGQIAVHADHSVTGSIRTFGFKPTSAQIHEAPVGENGPIIITLTLAADNSFEVPPGTWLSNSEYASYLAGYLYVNVHSAEHPSGEIRAQLLRIETASLRIRTAYQHGSEKLP